MKHYRIQIENGNYPLTYECTTIAEAYGCLESLTGWHPNRHAINLNELMPILVDMSRGKTLNYHNYIVGITIEDGEV